MSDKTVAILGATGVVGQQMLQCLEERSFPVGRLVPLASQRSVDAGKTVRFAGEDVPVRLAEPDAFEGVDIVLGAADDATARALMPEAVKRGAVCVDNSHAFRMDADVPLVVPEINAADIASHHGIIANPNCATIIGLVPVWPLHQLAGVTRLVLVREIGCVAAGEPVGETSPFQYQLAENLIPQIGGFKDEGYTSEELKMLNEGRKIMHLPELRVNCTCVRVPVVRSHSESITAEFERPISVEEARAALEAAPGVRVVDEPAASRYPMPLETSDQDLIYVGRIRRDLSASEGVSALTFWCCGDQIRKGAATNAVQIAEYLV